MTEIGAPEIAEGVALYSNFSKVQLGYDREEIQRRLDAGEEFAELPDALGSLQEFVGITDDAMRAFWLGFKELGIDPEERTNEFHAAFIGLLTGIRAQQLAQAAKDRQEK